MTVKKHSFKGKVFSKILEFFSMLNRNNKYLIFDTYLNKNDEINLNYKLNNVPTIFKSPKYENILSFIKNNKVF